MSESGHRAHCPTAIGSPFRTGRHGRFPPHPAGFGSLGSTARRTPPLGEAPGFYLCDGRLKTVALGDLAARCETVRKRGGGSEDPPPQFLMRHLNAPRTGRLARRTS